MSLDDSTTHFAETDSRGRHVRFGIKHSDRQYHMAIIGRTGMGKSTLMETLMAADIRTHRRHSRSGLCARCMRCKKGQGVFPHKQADANSSIGQSYENCKYC